jgi:hypothetical protein
MPRWSDDMKASGDEYISRLDYQTRCLGRFVPVYVYLVVILCEVFVEFRIRLRYDKHCCGRCAVILGRLIDLFYETGYVRRMWGFSVWREVMWLIVRLSGFPSAMVVGYQGAKGWKEPASRGSSGVS